MNRIIIDESAMQQLCEIVQTKFQRSDGYDEESLINCERSLKLIVTAKQGNVSEFTLVNAVPQRQLSSRAVTVSRLIDNGSIILSIAALCFQIAVIIMSGVGGNDNASSGDSAIESELTKWMSIIMIALSLLSSSKNKVLDKFKK